MAPAIALVPATTSDSSMAVRDPQAELLETHGTRILCVAEIRGQLSKLNALAKKYNASCIIHSGNFGFFDSESISRISLKYVSRELLKIWLHMLIFHTNKLLSSLFTFL